MQTTRLLPLLLCLCVGSALADTPIDLRHAASARTHVEISNVKGAVSVIGWDRPELQVTGQLGEGAQPLAITGSAQALSLKVEPEGRGDWLDWSRDKTMGPTRLIVHLPRSASVDVRVVSATLSIDGIDGGAIAVRTISGKTRVNARTPLLKVDSVSGGIELAGHAQDADLQTVSGDILAPVLGEKARLQTVSGEIQAAGGPWQSFSLSTVSGDVRLKGALAEGGHLGIDSMSGDVQLQLPPETSAKLRASTFSGDLRSDFGKPAEADHGPGSTLETRIGGGAGSIAIETFSGDLRIRTTD
jgi:DUF4097 and DUF4098 domain-containing protein YvlB